MKLNIIHNQDCLKCDNIADASIDLIISDPPYNLGGSRPDGRTMQGSVLVNNCDAFGDWDIFNKDDYDIFIIDYMKKCYRILKDGGSFYMFTAREDNGFFVREAKKIGFKYLNTLAIIKKCPLPHFSKTNFRSCFELCFYVCKGDKPTTFNFLTQDLMKNVYHYNQSQKLTTHPCEKPLNFIKLLIRISSNEQDIVYDGFIGSGTVAVAAQQLNRLWVGHELNLTYFNMCQDRLKQRNLLDFIEKPRKVYIPPVHTVHTE